MTAAGEPGFGPGCRSFLRDLAAQVDLVLASGGNDTQGHAARCPRCARVLAGALTQASWLRTRPPVPAALQSRAAYEAMLAWAIDALEASPAARLLAEAVPVAPAPDATWPVPCEDSQLVRAVAGEAAAERQVVPGWVWLRVKDRIRAEVERRTVVRSRWRRSRSVAVAAALVLGALLVVPLARTRGPAAERDPVIVMQRMEQAPLLDYLPTAVLRRGGGG